MSGKTILILGGGIGGVAAARALRRLCTPEHRVVVIERNAKFSLRRANFWLMTGERRRPEEGERELSGLAELGIEWVRAEIKAVDPVAKKVQTSAGALSGDYLVIALGAERHPEAVPGFAEAALDLYEAICSGWNSMPRSSSIRTSSLPTSAPATGMGRSSGV